MKRCSWVNTNNPLYIKYHDKEWAVPVHNDKKLFELLILEGAQAGLSWETILKKRDNYKKAYDNWNIKKIAQYNNNKITELMNNKGIVRNKQKILSSIKNAQVFLNIQKKHGSFDNYLQSFTNDKTTKKELSNNISKELKNKGMKFAGPTIIYAYLQAIGIINDHEKNCFLHKKT